MTRPILVTCLCVAALAGCTRTVVREVEVDRPVVRETIVEKPVVVEKERVIERVASAPLACSYAGVAYTSGALSCQSSYQYRCTNGTWERLPGSYC